MPPLCSRGRASPSSTSTSPPRKRWRPTYSRRRRGRNLQCDIASNAGVVAGGDAAEGKLGPIGVLVNNAGWDIFKPFTKTEPGEWEKLIAVNPTGALNMHHAVLPGMAARKARSHRQCRLRRSARVGSSGEAVYAACKGGLVAFSKTIAREHARHNITVNVVCPVRPTRRCSPA